MRKAHHYVAQSIQARFCDSDGLICVYDKDTQGVNRQHPKRTAVINDLYTIPTEEEEKSDILECKVFDPVDGEIVALIDRWIQPSYRFSESEIPQMASYIALQHARVPRTLKMADELGTALAVKTMRDFSTDKQAMDQAYAEAVTRMDGDKSLSREEFQDYFANLEKHFIFNIKREVTLGMSMSLTPIFFDAVMRMKWCIVDAPRDNCFITCDAPIVSIATGGPGVVQFGANLASPGFEIVFPLSPTVCVWIRKVNGQKRIKCSSARVAEFNYRTAYMAERYIFAQQDTARIRALLLQTAKTRQQPKIDREALNERIDAQNRC